MKSNTSSQPAWCCLTCGTKFGRWYVSGTYTGPVGHLATWHPDTCGVCGYGRDVTEPRDFGYLIPAWNKNLHFRLRPRANKRKLPRKAAKAHETRRAKADETRRKNKARKRMLKKIDDAVRARHDAFDPTPRLRKA